ASCRRRHPPRLRFRDSFQGGSSPRVRTQLMTPTTTELISKLRARLSTLGNVGDCRSENERAAHWATTRDINHCVSVLLNVDSDLAKPERLLREAEERRELVRARQVELRAQLDACPDFTSITNRNDRDRAIARQHALESQLELLEQGHLASGPGV